MAKRRFLPGVVRSSTWAMSARGASVAAQRRGLEGRQFVAEFAAALGVFKTRQPSKWRCHLAVKGRITWLSTGNRQLGEFSSAQSRDPLMISRVSGKIACTLSSARLLVSVLWSDILRCRTGQQLNIKLPCGRPGPDSRGFELALKEAEFDLEAGKAPFLKKITPFHNKNSELCTLTNRRWGSYLIGRKSMDKRHAHPQSSLRSFRR